MKDQTTDDVPLVEKVVRLAARGDGVTESGRYITGAAPGDLLHADGSVTTGPNHITPACQHFGICGGCQIQHVSDDAISAYVVERVLEPLRRVKVEPETVMPVHLSPAHSRRRTAMRATRTKGKVRIGYNAGGEHSIVDLVECPVLTPELFQLVEPLRQLLGPYLAERSAIGINMTLTDTGVDMLLSNLKANSLPLIEGLTDFAAEQGLARLSVHGPDGIETLVERETPVVHFAGTPVPLPPAAFLQATADGEAALVSAVTEIVRGHDNVADLFCGLGTFSLPLARDGKGRKVIAADAAGPAVKALQDIARRMQLPITTEHRDLFRKPLMAEELNGLDAVVMDPPRAGAITQSKQIALSKVPLVAAVSCNPATFARDAERLVAGCFTLKRLWPIDQFRWSTHVEIVAEFQR